MYFRAFLIIFQLFLLKDVSHAASAKNFGETKIEPPLRVITSLHYPPFSFRGPGNMPKGFDMDLVHLIALHMGRSITIHEVPFEALIEHLAQGKADIAVDAITPTDSRRAHADFTIPYYSVPNCSLSLEDNNKMERNTLRGKTIAVQRGSTQTGIVKLMKDQGMAGKVIVTESLDQSVQAVKEERADMAVMECASARQYIQLGNRLVAENLPIKRIAQPISIALPKKSPLLEKINPIIKNLEKQKVVEGLARRWFGPESEVAAR